MIKELKIEGYRKFKSLHLKGLSNINIIVGPNNSGKSSVLEAISMLANNDTNKVFGSPEIQYLYNYSSSLINNFVNECYIGAKTDTGNIYKKYIKRYSFNLRNTKIKNIRKKIAKEILLNYITGLKNANKDNLLLQIESLMRKYSLLYVSTYKHNNNQISEILFDVKMFLKDTRIRLPGKPDVYDFPYLLDPFVLEGSNKIQMVTYPYIVHNFEKIITHHYPNKPLYIILYDLIIRSERTDINKVINDVLFIGKNKIKNIAYSPMVQDIVLQMHNKSKILLSSMGTGFINLMNLIMLFHMGEKGIILLDEPTNTLHPYYIDELARYIMRHSEHSQFFITTHNMQLIEMLLDAAVHNDIGASVIRLSDEDKMELLDRDTANNKMNDIYNDLLFP